MPAQADEVIANNVTHKTTVAHKTTLTCNNLRHETLQILIPLTTSIQQAQNDSITAWNVLAIRARLNTPPRYRVWVGLVVGFRLDPVGKALGVRDRRRSRMAVPPLHRRIALKPRPANAGLVDGFANESRHRSNAVQVPGFLSDEVCNWDIASICRTDANQRQPDS